MTKKKIARKKKVTKKEAAPRLPSSLSEETINNYARKLLENEIKAQVKKTAEQYVYRVVNYASNQLQRDKIFSDEIKKLIEKTIREKLSEKIDNKRIIVDFNAYTR